MKLKALTKVKNNDRSSLWPLRRKQACCDRFHAFWASIFDLFEKKRAPGTSIEVAADYFDIEGLNQMLSQSQVIVFSNQLFELNFVIV